MNSSCPEGHDSETADFCSVCGKPTRPEPSTGGPKAVAEGGPKAEAAGVPARPPVLAASGPARVCPNCGSTSESGPTCSECLFAFGAPDSVAVWEDELWEVVVRPDRRYYEMIDPEDIEFPETPYSRRLPLVGDHVRIGRRRVKEGITPEIDLSGAFEDLGVSRRHVVLMRQPDGTWALVDQGSANGTYLNYRADPVPANQRLPLRAGDQIHIGAYTTLTVERVDVVVAPSREVSVPSKDTRGVGRPGSRIEISLLGPLGVTVGAKQVLITASHERAVLATLALRAGSSVSTGELEWAVWGEHEPATAYGSLKNHISKLRQKVGSNVIETTANGYRLVGRKEMVDAFLFEQRTGRGRQLLATGHPGAAVAELERALELWRGEPLPDLADGPAGAGEIARLLELRASAEEELFEGRLQLGDHHGVIPDLTAAVDAQPLRERRWAQLMLAFHRDGRQLEALRTFTRYGATLAEYGVEPSADIATLEGAIMLDRPELRWTPPDERPAGTA